MCELGGIWVQAKSVLPVLVPPFEYSNLKAVLVGLQALKLDVPADLDYLRDEIAESLAISPMPTARWNHRRDAFLKALPATLKVPSDASCLPRDAHLKGHEKVPQSLGAHETLGSLMQESNPSVLLACGEARLSNQEWKRATIYLDAYIIKKPGDWNAHFLRGVAYANCEEGEEADTAALTAFNTALLLAPAEADPNRLARFLSYRAAMFKRLRRLDEALADLTKARSLAANYYEAHDIKYNLACIYAMQGDRPRLFEMLEQLASAPAELARVRKHLGDYFGKFQDDAEFIAAITKKSPAG
jgi:Flp pilus assembly protein TadD